MFQAQQIIQQHPLVDQQPNTPAASSGTAQAAHHHALQKPAARQVDRLFNQQRGACASAADSNRAQPKHLRAGEHASGPAAHRPLARRPGGTFRSDADSLGRPAGNGPPAPLARGAAPGDSRDKAVYPPPCDRHQEPEPVGRAVQLPTPVAPNRGQSRGSRASEMQGTGMHAAMIFQHPQHATLIVH